jgi:thiamine phosphate synthase YjbQ (UPF0047 family)
MKVSVHSTLTPAEEKELHDWTLVHDDDIEYVSVQEGAVVVQLVDLPAQVHVSRTDRSLTAALNQALHELR